VINDILDFSKSKPVNWSSNPTPSICEPSGRRPGAAASGGAEQRSKRDRRIHRPPLRPFLGDGGRVRQIVHNLPATL